MTKQIILLALISLATLCCNKKSDGENGEFKDGEKIVATSFFPMYVATLNIVANVSGIRVVNLSAQSGSCVHNYQLTAAAAALIEKASVLIVNGGGVESFLYMEAAHNKNLTLIIASSDDNINFIPSEPDNGDDVKNYEWMSVENHIVQVKNIASQLSIWDTANAKTYETNSLYYIANLTQLKESLHSELSNVTNREIAVSHDGFLYLARELGLTVTLVIEKEHGAEPGAAELAAAVNAIRKTKPKALFTDNAHDSPSSRAVSFETKIPTFKLNLLTIGPKNDKDAYINIMRKNISTIKKALDEQ